MVTGHRERISRSRQYPGVRHRREGSNCSHRDHYDAHLSGHPGEHGSCCVGSWCQAFTQRVGSQNTDHDINASHIDHDYGCQGERHATWDVLVRFGYLFGEARNIGESYERHEHQSYRSEQAVDAGRHEWHEAALVCRDYPLRQQYHQAVNDEKTDDGEDGDDQDPEQPSGFPGPDDVEDSENDGEGYCNRPYRNIEEDGDVCAHPNEGEGTLERQREPRSHAAYRTNQWSHRPVEEVVRSPRSRHRGRKLGLTHHCRYDQDTGKEICEYHGRSGLRGGKSGQE